jgi:hypothetical protein
MDSLVNLRKFHSCFQRTYPSIYDASKLLAEHYAGVVQAAPGRGNLEIEAILGRRDPCGSFSNAVPHATVLTLIELLDSFEGWEEKTDWYLIYDYYVSKQERVRVTHHPDQRTHEHIVKTSLVSDDFGYKKEGPLGGFGVRVNMKLEQEVHDSGKSAHEFKSVKISMRRAFVVNSASLPKIKFRLELGESWFGETVAQAEDNRNAGNGTGTVECEIINAPLTDILAEQDKHLLFASLLLKIQDLFDFTSEPELCSFVHMPKR